MTLSFARAQQGQIGVELGLGLSSNYGIFGAGGRYYIFDNVDLHITTGIDRTGSQFGAGSRWYFTDFESDCYFVLNCRYRHFLGGTLVRTQGGELTYSSAGLSGVYDYSQGFLVHATIGSNATYKSIYTSVELGYRFWTSKPSATYKAGSFVQSQQEKLNDIRDSLSLAAVVGFVF